ncbi:MAG: PD40 domain-containing protein [Bacteroidetes bacterium]|nr:PD40 domain-containing protein [Bacteroidota bacterium]
MKKFVYLFIFLLSVSTGYAQKKQPAIKAYSSDEFKLAKKDAEAYYKELNYSAALKIYERLLVNEPNSAEFNYKLGMCFINTNVGKHKGIPFLEFAANANTKDKPKDVTFDLGKGYLYAGLYDKAIETFEAFRLEKGGTVDSKLKFNQWVEWSHAAKKMSDAPVSCTFENLGKTVNSNQADYRPIIGAADTVVYFCSKRKGTVGGLTDDFGESPSDVYFFMNGDSAISKAKNAGINLNTEFYEETMYLNMGGDMMLIYREGPESNGDIYLANMKGKSWDKPVLLTPDFRTKVLETGASISPDGLTLYFSAEAVDGKTGKDIWICTRSSSTNWSKPEKLQGPINTDGDEDNPLMWVDGKTLFFSSTMHGSMGGLDIFKSYRTSTSEGFGAPENLGYPFNSVYDDYNIALSCDGKTGFIASVREGGLGDYDIYKFKFEKPIVNVPMCWLKGKGITSIGTAAKGALVFVTEAATGAAVAEIEANEATGRFDVALAPGDYKILLKHPKAGRVESSIKVEAGQSRLDLDLVFP